MLANYLDVQSEQALYQGQKFSRKAIENHLSPEEIIILHKSVLESLEPVPSEKVILSFDILLEVMMGYGLAYRELQSLRHQQHELRTEIEIATNLQQTLLGTHIPIVKGLDIGALSVPAKHMNGDYYHFVQDESQNINVAIADVIGKGIPAAMCMSMIKYAMDSLPESRNTPSTVLENLNRVVEQNVDPSMFITMFYGMYSLINHTFRYASAGHEPGIFFCSKMRKFSELEAKGLLLGIDKRTKYQQFEKMINPGDMIILMSDGVTECRTENGFLEKDALIAYIEQNIHLSAQEIVNRIFKELEKLQHFQLRDDFTLIILKREV
ncbi:MAG TPA: PP2C family protein-serine/threonine phosphatase [Pseudoneobacillus sp.]|nr:PP2C family protein-serine/threonine phosphatase [Pseudoneobacillus sp.]